ncbi:MAG: aminopeptidase [Pseudomonadota bacterium]
MEAEFSIDADDINALARLIIHNGLGLKAGQELLITASVEALPLVRELASEAYKSGCALVTPMLTDSAFEVARIKWAHEDYLGAENLWLAEAYASAYAGGAARLALTGSDPNLLQGLDQDRIDAVAKSHINARRITGRFSSESIINWTIAPYPFVNWAAAIWPDLPRSEAQAKLWALLRVALRLDREDPLKAWQDHNEKLADKARLMNEMRFDALRFQGPGTDLTVGLADQHHWHGGKTHAQNGCSGNTNMPTEEIFSCPHKMKVDGHATSTRPLVLGGQKIDGIYVEFKQGTVITVKSTNGQSISPLETLLASDDGARRLGEVALVPHSSTISKMDEVFLNTLLDENSSCHIAFGQSYRKTLISGPDLSNDEAVERGANSSSVHFDWMIGSDQLDIDGLTGSTSTPIFRSGEWVI